MSECIEKTIKVLVHGKYLLKISEKEGPFPLFLTFHGYGGNARENLDHALKIPGTENWIVCSVEGLSHYHLYQKENGHPKPGGCWITFYEADQTIRDIVGYIDAVVENVHAEYSCTNKLVLMGFSMGTIPAWASAAYGKQKPAGVISVGYHLFSKLQTEKLKGLPVALLGRGIRDPHYSETTMESNREILEKLGISVTICLYDGGHNWDPDFYASAGNWLGKIQ